MKAKEIQLIGAEVAILWDNGREDFLHSELLRVASPSAENKGEPDLFGNIIGGDSRTNFPGVTVESWDIIGNYAVKFNFSDGHNTGLFSYDYLLKIADELKEKSK